MTILKRIIRNAAFFRVSSNTVLENKGMDPFLKSSDRFDVDFLLGQKRP
jgi:hypothetical protein